MLTVRVESGDMFRPVENVHLPWRGGGLPGSAPGPRGPKESTKRHRRECLAEPSPEHMKLSKAPLGCPPHSDSALKRGYSTPQKDPA